jgi:hypothetical protein
MNEGRQDASRIVSTLQGVAGPHELILLTAEKQDYPAPMDDNYRLLSLPDLIAHWFTMNPSFDHPVSRPALRP